MSNSISPNGHGPAPIVNADELAAQQMANAAFLQYPQLCGQLGALMTLLGALPLPLMLEANERHQRASVLTLPANVTAEQAAAVAQGLRNDARVIKAAMQLREVCVAVNEGR